MYIGVLRLGLEIVGARSLKDRRSAVRSFKDRAQAKYKISIAEVGDLDNPRHAVLGVAVVSNSATQCDQVLQSVASMASTLPDAILYDRATEIFPFGEGGRGIQGGIEQALEHHSDGYDSDEEDLG